MDLHGVLTNATHAYLVKVYWNQNINDSMKQNELRDINHSYLKWTQSKIQIGTEHHLYF